MARKNAKPTGWNRALAYPITLRDGYTIETMKQAAGHAAGSGCQRRYYALKLAAEVSRLVCGTIAADL